MAWRYKITAVNPLADKDYLDFHVEFSTTTDARIYIKTYRVYIDELPDTTILTLKAIVDVDLLKIIKFDELSATLTGYIGTYITAP